MRDKSTDPGLLVLNSGRVIHGELLPRTGGYDVLLPAGRMFVPSVQIRFTAASMDDAYQRMRDSVAELTPSAHLELARWCLLNHIPHRARREVLDALHLDPYNDNARRMLEDLRREEQRVAISVDKKNTPQKSSSPLDLVFSDRRSLGGLPQELATTFTRRIQPLVQNKCGNSRCHGDGLNSFVVTPIRGYSTSHVAERNLAAVLNQIDFSDPERSPLLMATKGPHGGASRLLFSGQTGRLQSRLLQAWVTSAATELGPAELPQDHSGSSSDTIQLVSGVNVSVDVDSDVGTSESDAPTTDQPFLRAADAATRVDAFDPKVFNRRYHGKNHSALGMSERVSDR